MPIGWRSRRGGPGRLDEHVERINEIANGLVAVSLAMQAEEPETARRTADETLWQASELLTEAVAQAEARARRRRTVSRVATATVAVTAAAAIAISLPEVGPTVGPDRLAGDEVPADVRQLDPPWADAPSVSLRARRAASPPELGSVVPADLQRGRRAATPASRLTAQAPSEDEGTPVTAAGSPDPVRDAPRPTEPASADDPATDDAVDPAETHPGLLASGRAQPSSSARPGALAGPPEHAQAAGGVKAAARRGTSDA